MEKTASIVEYGVPIDPRTIIEPPDAAVLELEPGHPGLGEEAYVRRRHALFALCRKHRLENLGPPIIDYTAAETRIWREGSPKLDALHRRQASSNYLQCKDGLGILQSAILQLPHLIERL